MSTVRYTRDDRDADTDRMWSATRIAARLAVLGAGLVVAGTHGSGAVPATPVAAQVTSVTYRPPVVHAAAMAKPRRIPPRPRPRAVPTHRIALRHATKPATRKKPAVSFQSALMAAVARIPTYRSGSARWVVSRAYAFWGTADWYHDVLYVSPDVPRSKLYDVAVHEWSHELSVLDYAGDVNLATTAMNAWFGGSGLTGPERAADCMAIVQGATWTHYTTCTNAHWRAGARLLVAGRRL